MNIFKAKKFRIILINYNRKETTLDWTIYTLNELIHRLDGHAVECWNGDKEWYIYGEEYTEQEFEEYIKKF